MQNVTANTVSDVGMSMDDIRMFCQFLVPENQGANMPEGCVSPLELVQNFQQAIVGNELPIYADSGLMNIIQSGSNQSVAVMYRVEYKQMVYALAITDKQKICTATGSQFCGCLNAGTIGG
jgi:hypothetical protein